MLPSVFSPEVALRFMTQEPSYHLWSRQPYPSYP